MNARAGMTDLSDFESDPFNHLGTSPNLYKLFQSLKQILSFIRNPIRKDFLFCQHRLLKTAPLRRLWRFAFRQIQNNLMDFESLRVMAVMTTLMTLNIYVFL